jgi:septal ring factor EnvC (AmiA/AmiB activator)
VSVKSGGVDVTSGGLGRLVQCRLRLASVIFALLLVPGSAVGQKKDDVVSEQRKLQQTQKQLREQRGRAAEARKKEVSLLAELEQIDQTLARKKGDVARLTARITRIQTDVADLRSDIRRLEGRRALQQSSLATRLRAMYKIQAQGGALPLVFGGDDPVGRAVLLRHLTTLAAVDARLIQEYVLTTDGLAGRKSREEGHQAELEALRSEAERERADIDREATRRRGLLAKVRGERAYHERMVGELTEAARRLEAFIQSLQEKQRRAAKVPTPSKPGAPPAGVGFATLRGVLPWPAEGRLVASFGAQVNPRFGTRTFRSGIDIEAGEGTEIAAVYAGHVVYTGWFKGYGNLIILDHGNEYYTLYAHVAGIDVREGDEVRQGQRIGTVGDTGSLAGPRLYFEVRYQGKPQDPERWLRQRG